MVDFLFGWVKSFDNLTEVGWMKFWEIWSEKLWVHHRHQRHFINNGTTCTGKPCMFLYGQLKHHLACDAKTDYLADTGAIATPHWKLHYSNWSNSIMKLASVAWQYMLSLQSYWSPRLMEWVWKSPFISRSTRGHHLQTCQHSLN